MSQRQRIELPITEEQLDAMLENSYCQGHGSRDGEVERLRGAILAANSGRAVMVRWCIDHNVQRGISPLSMSRLTALILEAALGNPQ